MIYMFLSNNPLSGDINSSNLPCFAYETLSRFLRGAKISSYVAYQREFSIQ